MTDAEVFDELEPTLIADTRRRRLVASLGFMVRLALWNKLVERNGGWRYDEESE